MLCLVLHAKAQIKKPTQWHFESAELKNGEAELQFVAILEEGWHIYSQHLGGEGPAPTVFEFETSQDYTLAGKALEGDNPIDSYDSTFEIKVRWYERSAVFKQKIKVYAPTTVVKGSVTFMVCTKVECLLPETIRFNIAVNVKDYIKVKPQSGQPKQTVPEQSEQKKGNDNQSPEKVEKAQLLQSSVQPIIEIAKPQLGLWSIFIAGFLGGLAALLMPCIFPMIPFTVGMFSKQGQIRQGSVLLSMFFGLSIILIYVVLGLVVTVAFGSDALNDISTNGIVNLLFFALLVVFAASFLGAFEITLPSSWANKIDAKSGSSGLGVAFAALALVLVSFSCTGPIIGTLLVEASSTGNYVGPTIGMLGFSVALALPFTLFSMFPSWLTALPKSGGWLNSVKVTLGFLELALALKFLSNVDLAYHWNWFDREVFLVLWIVIFGMLGFYLMGKIKFIHDSAIEKLSVGRLFLSICTLAFALYLIPGLWGAPLKTVAAFLPPQHTQDFDLSLTMGLDKFASDPLRRSGPGSKAVVQKKHADVFKSPNGLDAFFDYEEGLAFAKQNRKPVLIDFTGHACVNCRKMEATVWPEPEVFSVLRDDYVLIQLYVDDKTELPDAEQIVSDYSGKKLVTIGNKWSDFQASVFNTNSQPYYVLLSEEGRVLVPPRGANYNPGEFRKFLDAGLEAHRATAITSITAESNSEE